MAEPAVDIRHVYIDDLAAHEGADVTLKGWLYNKRGSKNLLFLVLRDGTGIVQCVLPLEEIGEKSKRAAESATQESALAVTGKVVRDERQVGGFEVQASSVELLSLAEEYPITPKEHGIDFLMSNRHLWLRSRRQWAIMRIRNRVIMAIHEFFQSRGFVQMDAPIITGNAVEGTSTLFEIDYFDEKAYLTQSGQLYGEAMAMAMGRIYTFGPTFRAEKSKTRRHLTEFWMIEPEMAFYDLEMNMDLAEDFLVHVAREVLSRCKTELEVLHRDTSALERVRKPFPRISYSDAVDLLRSDDTATMLDRRIVDLKEEESRLKRELEENRKLYGQANKAEKRRIDALEIEARQRLSSIEEDLRNVPLWKESARNFEWGGDFGGSDETVLTWHFDRPIIVHRYPAEIKAFYMRINDDGRTVAA
ncbi:MAG: amino acid--tRNA ligase-related protein, partial [Rhodothermales bacterium]